MSGRAFVEGVSFGSAVWSGGSLEVSVYREGVLLRAVALQGTKGERCWADAEDGSVLSLGLCRAIWAVVPDSLYATVGRAVAFGYEGVLTYRPADIGGDRGVFSVGWSPA